MAIQKRLFPFDVPYQLKPKDQLYFLHLEKTGGTSFTELLDHQFPDKDRLQVMWLHRIDGKSPEELEKFRLFRGHLNYNFHKRLNNKPITITMLREPIDRVVSLYYFWRNEASKEPGETPWDVQIAVDKDFEEFLADERLRHALFNYQTRTILTEKNNLMLKRTEDQLIARGINRLHEFPFVGLLDRFNDSIALLYYTFGWFPKDLFKPPKTKSNPNRPSIDDIPPHICERIKELNRADIALYEYAQELFETRYLHMLRDMLMLNSREHEKKMPVYEVDLRFNDKDTEAFGQGWHYAERKQRWTGPQNESKLYFLLNKDRDLQAEIVFKNAITEEVLNSFELFVNETPITLERFDADGNYVFMGIIPREVLQKAVHLTDFALRVSHTASPPPPPDSEAPVDSRLMGLSFQSLHIAPRIS